ncbi:GtrA family protein [Vibrio gallicus]|uniref:GtrA family protein n=1 Tax=Vibrio gallicus TaxID=190897 RepID=UPI0021C45FD2|nr:GtrA family protein [Vibrio gallicus]
MKYQFLRFAVVGVVGFVVDITVFALCIYWIQMPTLLSRVTAFSVAVCVTWLGNRIYTFGNKSPIWPQLKRFAVSATASVIPNIGIFHLVLSYLGESVVTHLLAFVMGVLAGLCSNYLLNTLWVFKKDPPAQG